MFSFSHSHSSAFRSFSSAKFETQSEEQNYNDATFENSSVVSTIDEVATLTSAANSSEQELENLFELNWNEQADDISSFSGMSSEPQNDTEFLMGCFSDEFYQSKYQQWREKVAHAHEMTPRDSLRSIVARNRPRDCKGRLLSKQAIMTKQDN